jgi:hypothetical protein
VVEGAPLAASGDNADDDCVEVFQDFGSRKAEGRNSDAGKSLIASGVASRAIAALMRFAIDLYC